MYWLLNLVSFVINTVVVGSSNFGVLGESNATISDDNPTLITPADWAFSIWGLIFLTEAILVIWQVFNSEELIVTKGLSIWFALACILQALWSIAFAQEQLELSAVLLVLIAACLGTAVIRLASFRKEEMFQCPGLSYWIVNFPIGLHAGWVLAACLVNINVAMNDPSVSDEVTALILCLVAATVAAGVASAVFLDRVYLLSIAWALAGVADNDDYRKERLGTDIADGVTEAIIGLYIALVVFGVLAALYSLFECGAQPLGANRSVNRSVNLREQRGPRSKRNERPAQRQNPALTAAIVGP